MLPSLESAYAATLAALSGTSSGTSLLFWGVVAALAMGTSLAVTYRKIRNEDRARFKRRISADTLTLNGIKGSESLAVPSARDLVREVLYLYKTKLEFNRVNVEVADGLESIRIDSRPRAFAALLSDLIGLSIESVERAGGERWVKVEIEVSESCLRVRVMDSSGMSFDVRYPLLAGARALPSSAAEAPALKIASR